MKVTKVSCEVQYSQLQPDGSWKKVCVSADADLEPGEDRSKAHLALYRELAADLRTAFSGNGRKTAQPPPPSSKKQRRKSTPPERRGNTQDKPRNDKEKNGNPETKICPIHNVPMKRWANENGGAWYSHNDETTGGEWCPGKPKKKGRK